MQVLVCHGDVREVLANEDLDVRVVKTKSDETAQPVVVGRKLTVIGEYRMEVGYGLVNKVAKFSPFLF